MVVRNYIPVQPAERLLIVGDFYFEFQVTIPVNFDLPTQTLNCDLPELSMTDRQFDLAVIGTGFASTFFLQAYLNSAPESARVVVLERGNINNNTPGDAYSKHQGIDFADTVINGNPLKGWIQRIGFGGGTCWTGNTPRMHPNDFKTQTLYARGEDWPISYDELEPFYIAAEQLMSISGSSTRVYPRSKPYPLPAHRFNALDRAFAEKYPELYIPMPSARPSAPGAGRAICCANGICSTCPIAAKFQIDFHMKSIYSDKRVTLITEANVTHLDIQTETVKGVYYTKDGQEQSIKCDLAAVGAHGIMTPFILLKSGLTDPALGKYLNEQVSFGVDVLLDGLPNYDGSQIMTGLGLMGLDGDFRRDQPGYLLENWNVPWLRAEENRWTERGYFKIVFEEVPQQRNSVTIAKQDPSKPYVNYQDDSAYGKTGLANADKIVQDLLSGLPVEDYSIQAKMDLGGEAHIQGTTRMGKDPNTSVVDANLVHHRVRNLLALGSGVFTTCPAANPTLTLSALSLMAAHHLFA